MKPTISYYVFKFSTSVHYFCKQSKFNEVCIIW